MATVSSISPANNTLVIEENTTSGIVPQSGASMGTVVVPPPDRTFGVGQVIMYLNEGAIKFTQSGNNFKVIPVANYLLTYSGAPS